MRFFAHLALAILAVLGVAVSTASAADWYDTGQRWGIPLDGSTLVNYATADVDVAPDGTIATPEYYGGTVRLYNADRSHQRTFGTYGTGVGEIKQATGIAYSPIDGTIFVGDTVNRKVLVFSPTGAFLREFPVTRSGPSTTSGYIRMDFAPSGDLFVVDSADQRVERFSHAGALQATWGAAGSAPGQFSTQVSDIALSPDGASVYVGDIGNVRVMRFTPSGTYLNQIGSAGSGPGQFGYISPHDVSVASDGTVLTFDYDRRIERFTPAGAYLGQLPWRSEDSRGSRVGGLEVGPSDRITIVYWNTFRGEQFTSAGGYLGEFGSAGIGNGNLSSPQDLAVQSDGKVLVVEGGNGRISRFTQNGQFVDHIASLGTGSAPLQLGAPIGLEVAADDTIYAADRNSHSVYRYSADGRTQLARWGSTAGSTTTKLSSPYNVDVDPADGTIWIADTGNARVVHVSADLSTYLGKFGAAGTAPGQMQGPSDVAVAADGTLWVGQIYNHRVEHYTRAGVFLGSIGNGTTSGIAAYPHSVEITPQDTLLITDWNRNSMNEYTQNGALLHNAPFSGRYVAFVPGTRDVLATGADSRVQRWNWDASDPTASTTTSVEYRRGCVSVDARDTGSGLASSPYSFDGGATWTADHRHCESGLREAHADLDLRIRDAVGNTLTASARLEGREPRLTARASSTYANVCWSVSEQDRIGPGFATEVSIDGGSSWAPLTAQHCIGGLRPGERAAPHVLARSADGQVSDLGEVPGTATPDHVAPRITAPAIGGTGILLRSSTGSIQITDDESGLDAVAVTFLDQPVPLVGGAVKLAQLPEGRGVLKITGTDMAGNDVNWNRRLVVDHTAPTIAPSGTLHVLDDAVQLPVRDRLSGPASAFARSGRLHLGRNVVRLHARDRSGNDGSRRVVVYRHVALADPSRNHGLDQARWGSGAITTTFAFTTRSAPWYGNQDDSPWLVREAQGRLVLFGFLDAGVARAERDRLGMGTIDAVKRFQRARGIPAIATIGPRTRSALDRELVRQFHA